MLGYQYHRVLNTIAKISFPEAKILPFRIEIHSKEMKTKHGDYHPSKRTIRIFNLSQRIDYTISTAIHELAHHCEFSIYGNTGHSKQFYFVFRKLLETSIKMGIVDYSIIRTQTNASDISSLEKYFGPISISGESISVNEETVIKVLNSFSHKNKLKNKGYFYDEIEKAWGKIIPNNELDKELSFLSTFMSSENIVTRSLFDLSFEAIYYIFVPNGFNQREMLKKCGFFYKEWKRQKGWAKKIPSTDLEKEKFVLSQIGITDYKVSSSLK